MSPDSNQNLSIHTIFSTNGHIPLDMWKNIKQQLEGLKLDTNRLKYVQKSTHSKAVLWQSI